MSIAFKTNYYQLNYIFANTLFKINTIYKVKMKLIFLNFNPLKTIN